MKFLLNSYIYFKNKHNCYKNKHELFIGAFSAGATTYDEHYGCYHCKHKSSKWFTYRDKNHKSEMWRKSYTNADGDIDLRLILGSGLMCNPIIKTK